MTSILEQELAQQIAEALERERVPFAITITRTVVTGPADPPWEPPPSAPVDYDARGWAERYELDLVDGSTILSTDQRVIVLMSPPPAKATGEPSGAPATITPKVGDSVTVRGSTYLVVAVTFDPAMATATCQARS